jgi:hypothetical protein
MEDEEKSGLQISLGDLVSFFSFCCAFGVPVLFFIFIFIFYNFLNIVSIPRTSYISKYIYSGTPVPAVIS